MSKSIISLILLCCLQAAAHATELQLKEGIPERYVVVKGDTLWDISAHYLKDPWRWPELWQMNRDEVKDPHWIYPGDVLVLDLSGATPKLRLLRGDEAAEPAAAPVEAKNEVKLSPRIRVEDRPTEPIPTIPLSVIGPFLSQPLVVEEEVLNKGPRIAASQEGRFVLGAGNLAYVRGITEDQGKFWQIFRPGKTLIDPDTEEVLGHEAIYLGEARVLQFGNPSTLEIIKSTQEIGVGDYLMRGGSTYPSSFTPHSPAGPVKGRIMSAYGTLNAAELGQNSVVAINRGRNTGVEDGQVLALYRKGETVKTAEGPMTLPDERYGLLFVFRTFNKVAYGIIMSSTRPAHVLDTVQNP
ncbi:MAG: LysM peptidoglycan-binding domain-containing protein [Pseudomonadota bacterium]